MAKKSSEFEVLKTAKEKIWTLDHALRQEIIIFLRRRKESDVTSIHKEFGIDQSATSQHLSILRRFNFVKTRKEGKQVIYSVNESEIAALIENAGKI